MKLGELSGLDLRYNHSSVARWLRGETPRRPTAELIAEVLSGTPGRPITIADIGIRQRKNAADAALQLPLRPSESARLLASLAHDDLERRRALLEAGFDLAAFSSAALRWLVAPRTAVPAAHGSRVIGITDVEDIREATRASQVALLRGCGGRTTRGLAGI